MSSHADPTSAESVAQRLLDSEGDDAAYHELRFAAMAQAHAWQATWLAAELLSTFEHADQHRRARSETAAIVQGLLRSARLARSHPAEVTARAWTNPVLAGASITAAAMIITAFINHWGETGSSRPAASIVPAVVRPNIQIVMPTAQTPPTVIVQPASAAAQLPASAKPAVVASTAPVPHATPTPATVVPSPPVEASAEAHQP